MATFQARLNTYTNWPIHLIQWPVELAQAGLFYTAVKDSVKWQKLPNNARSLLEVVLEEIHVEERPTLFQTTEPVEQEQSNLQDPKPNPDPVTIPTKKSKQHEYLVSVLEEH